LAGNKRYTRRELMALGLALGAGAALPAAVRAESATSEQPRRSAAELMPPLPFNNPQVGPVIRRGNQDDVNLRTTAFIPTRETLERLSPYDPVKEEGRWIRIDLGEQLLFAYEGARPVRGFVVSTGRPQTPTVTGDFRIRAKVRSQTMRGGSVALGTYYNLANVEWVQYFYADYGIHGTYWHNNFGQPMSHGCVNMTNLDAKWLFDWAGPRWDNRTIWFSPTPDNPGTRVVVHA
jgi:lipoprotein-anchoring transpeptidase ErfK/SrfK